ncbi:MAG: MBL fold metallo-hydrolase, partial [Ruminococcus sp.]|nr:MBL fold metallo-hydrolase [Ruminococcus sp.]
YLMIEENGKRILISGCSHKGIVNIAEWFKPDVLVGGFHFNKLPLDGNLKGYAERLDSQDTAFYTCHCTGVEQYAFMKRYMKNLHYISTGDIIEL